MSEVEIASPVFAVRAWTTDMPLLYVDLSHIEDEEERHTKAVLWDETLTVICSVFSLEDLLRPHQIDAVFEQTQYRPGIYSLDGARWEFDYSCRPHLISDVKVVRLEVFPRFRNKPKWPCVFS